MSATQDLAQQLTDAHSAMELKLSDLKTAIDKLVANPADTALQDAVKAEIAALQGTGDEISALVTEATPATPAPPAEPAPTDQPQP